MPDFTAEVERSRAMKDFGGAIYAVGGQGQLLRRELAAEGLSGPLDRPSYCAHLQQESTELQC